MKLKRDIIKIIRLADDSDDGYVDNTHSETFKMVWEITFDHWLDLEHHCLMSMKRILQLLVSVEGLNIPVLSVEDLIKNKESTGREKDALDAKMLKKRLIPNL